MEKDSYFKVPLRSERWGTGEDQAADEGDREIELDFKNSVGRLFRYSSQE